MEGNVIALIIWILVATVIVAIAGLNADGETRIQLFIVLIISVLVAFKKKFS